MWCKGCHYGSENAVFKRCPQCGKEDISVERIKIEGGKQHGMKGGKLKEHDRSREDY